MDDKGNPIVSHYTKGLSSTLDMTSEVGDKVFDNPDIYPNGVYIIPVVAGTVKVRLLDQADSESYTYSTAEVNAYIGRPFEGRVKAIIKDGTTSTGVKVVW